MQGAYLASADGDPTGRPWLGYASFLMGDASRLLRLHARPEIKFMPASDAHPILLSTLNQSHEEIRTRGKIPERVSWSVRGDHSHSKCRLR